MGKPSQSKPAALTAPPKGGAFCGYGKISGKTAKLAAVHKSSPFGGAGRDQRKRTERVRTQTPPVISLRSPDSPFCRCATSSPGRGKSSSEMGPLAWRQGFQLYRKLCGSAKRRPLRRSRASSPKGGSQDLKSVAKVSGAMTKYMGVLLALPLGEVASPQAMTERAHCGKNPFRLAAARQATFPKGTAFCSGGKLSGCAKKLPLRGSWHGVSRD